MVPSAIRGNEDAASGEVSVSSEERRRLDGFREFVGVSFLGGNNTQGQLTPCQLTVTD